MKRLIFNRDIIATIKLALPMIATGLLSIGWQVSDVIMSDKDGPTTLSSVALSGQLFSAVFLFSVGIAIGVSTQISRYNGANDNVSIRQVFQQGMWIFALLGVCVAIATVGLAYIPYLMGSTPDIAEHTKRYLLTLAIPAGFFVFSNLARCFLDGMEYPRITTIIQLATLPLNILGNWFFLTYTTLGAQGMAISTGICYLVYVTLFFSIIYRGKRWRRYRLFQKIEGFNWNITKQLLKIGFPIGLSIIMEIMMFALVSTLVSRTGSINTGANQVTLNFLSVIFMVPLGIASALTIRIANAYGANNWKILKVRVYGGIFLCFLATSIISVLILLFHYVIPKIYTRDVEIIAITTKLLLIIALFEIVDGLQICCSGILRGLGDTRITILYAFLSYWIIGVPLGCLLAYVADWGIYGLWIGIAGGLTVFASLAFQRIIKRLKHAPH